MGQYCGNPKPDWNLLVDRETWCSRKLLFTWGFSVEYGCVQVLDCRPSLQGHFALNWLQKKCLKPWCGRREQVTGSVSHKGR
jgi:hypothetical protein